VPKAPAGFSKQQEGAVAQHRDRRQRSLMTQLEFRAIWDGTLILMPAAPAATGPEPCRRDASLGIVGYDPPVQHHLVHGRDP